MNSLMVVQVTQLDRQNGLDVSRSRSNDFELDLSQYDL